MAESKPIQEKDIFAPDLFDKAIAGATEMVRVVNELNGELKNTYEITKKGASKNKLADSSDLIAHTKALKDYALIEKASIETAKLKTKAEADLLKVEQEKEKLLQQQIKTAKAQASAQAASAKEAEKTAKAQAKLNSEYQQAAASLTKLEKRLLDNEIAGRKTSVTARLLADEHEKMRTKIDGAEHAAGRFQRNVGNYAQQLRALQKELQGLEPGTKQFNDLAKKTGELKDRINDAKDATKAFAKDSKAATAKTLFSQIGGDIKELDFAGAADKAKQFALVIKSLTFAEAAEGVKSLGSAILNVGKSLLFNPFTLIVAGIAAVVYVLYDFGKAMYDAQFNTKVFNDSLAEQSKELKKYAERVKETQISIKETLGIYSAFQADQKRKEIKDSDEILEIRKAHIEKQFALAEELGIKLNAIENNRAKVFKGLLPEEFERRKKFNAEVAALEAERDRLISNARAVQRLENIQAEIADNIKRGEAANEFNKKANEDRLKRDLEYLEKKKKQQEEFDKKVLAEMEAKEEKKQKSKSIIDEYNAKQDVTESEEVWWNKEEGITLEQHNQDVANIEKTKADKDARDKKDDEARKKRQKEEIDTTLNFVDQLGKIESEAKEKQLDNDLDMRQRNIMQQQDLAARGLNNTLAFEKAAAAKDEAEKQKLAKEQEKREKEIAFLKLFAAYADKGDPDQALAKSLVQMAIATAISGSFIEGTENVGKDIKMKGRKIHNGTDGYLALFDGDERIVDPENNKKMGDISNDDLTRLAIMHNNGQLLPSYIMNMGSGSMAENMTNSMLLHQVVALNSEIKEIKQVLKERPTTSFSIDKDGIVSKKEFKNGLNRVARQKPSSPHNYL